MYLLLFLLFLFVVSVNATPCYELVAPGYDCNKYGGAVWTGQSGLWYQPQTQKTVFIYASISTKIRIGVKALELDTTLQIRSIGRLITAIVLKRMQS